MNKLNQLKMLINSQEEQDNRGNLTETGKSYLNGLRTAFALVSGDEKQ